MPNKQFIFGRRTLKHINPEIKEQLQSELSVLGYKYRNNLMEWGHIKHIFEKELLPLIFELFEEEFNDLNHKQEKLQAKVNQLSFGNDPERDRRMIELYNQGLSRAKIAKEVGMSKWGVSKALRRLGVN